MEKMTNTRFEVEKFNDQNNFELWKLKVRDSLVEQGLHKALDGKRKKPVNMSDDEWEDLDARGLNTLPFVCAWTTTSSSISLERKQLQAYGVEWRAST